MKLDTEKVIYSLMWWIQDLRDRGKGGGANPNGRGASLLFWSISPGKLHENEKKWTKKEGARVPGAAMDPPMQVRKRKVSMVITCVTFLFDN